MNKDIKLSWYDGAIYDRLIDPIAGKSYIKTVMRLIDTNSSVLDLGCGTGSLALGIAGMCRKVTGVDLSSKMIERARKKAGEAGARNVEFINRPAGDYLESAHDKFDYIIMTQLLHEVKEDERVRIIDGAKRISGKFIIAEFLSPSSDTLGCRMANLMEFMAGRDHYRNYKDWISKGGITGFLNLHGLKITDEKMYRSRAGKIVKAMLV